jgi:hypothetical protein
MRHRLPLFAVAAVLLFALGGCTIGSDDAGGGEDESDKRALALECFAEEDVDVSLEGEEGNEEIVIGEGDGAPRIKFFLTSGEAEAAQFEGRGEGAEQIGSTLLYVNDGSDELLETVEGCLAGI